MKYPPKVMKNAHLKTRNGTHEAECEISTPQIVVLINRNSGHCGRRLELVCHAKHSLSFVDSAPTTVIGLVGIRYPSFHDFPHFDYALTVGRPSGGAYAQHHHCWQREVWFHS